LKSKQIPNFLTENSILYIFFNIIKFFAQLGTDIAADPGIRRDFINVR